ncbi:ABC transporter substrate-binding protein [Photorhabdus laumondii subsp. laumondii]|uniref:Photorhabdus luminescens subsp. laumondii TTO1 complete genome segment 13/17 n=2 Tax=Photorhabdus laumondii subsp. laumondii TaxID=141679 RepID=Q7N0Z1_PHOLL|nr:MULTISPECIES: ABC transporter substrate-binding protein [Photorhabdus]AWK43360.1 iron transporter [Photorhabdus laumondii subsp. laumondii]AXG44031.1 iron transporter [Photorhabdus laumondii subsp. laumondii]AXG48664.1 iron transporter [Photorhabdus laumondii subsp. laumondii]KTL63314.1 iron transporter [Photorhabdus laumondii subsp. laumondii]MCC8383244.1 ABC transporter substrate-binding protein [Photorhabdus laumondii]
MALIHCTAKYILTAILILLPVFAQAKVITVKDVAGRKVKIDAPVSRVMLADSRILIALNILHPDNPLKGIVAWDNALEIKSPDLATTYEKDFPQLRDIPVFPNPYHSDFNVEKALTYKPDLVIFDIGLQTKLNDSGTIMLLEKAGIQVIFIDFHQYPLTNTIPSMILLGKVFNEEENAQKFIEFYQERMKIINQRVGTLGKEQRPPVFIERHAGMLGAEHCCKTFGNGNFGEFVTAAGGDNLGARWFSGIDGEVNEKQLIVSNPEFYLMTAANWDKVRSGSFSVPLGYTGDLKQSQERLKKLLTRPKLSVLRAFREKQVIALYHQYYDTPFNIIAVEIIAKFLHPKLFEDIDPQADNLYLHKTFTALDGNGVFWVTAK